MKFSGFFRKLFRKLFRRKEAKTVYIDRMELLNGNSSGQSKTDMDKSIFEIVHTISMKEHINLISGRVRKGFFRTGDSISIYPKSQGIPKCKAVILNIKTALVEVNKISSGIEADFLIEIPDGEPEINPGDKVYKV